MAATNPGDVASILAAYEPRETTFQKPSGRGELGRKDRQNLTSGQPSQGDQTTPNKVIHKELWDAGVIGMVSRVSWGKYYGKDACLVVFSFSFKSGDSALRFRNSNVKITFERHPSSPPEQENPSALVFAPRKIYGIPTVESKSLTYNVELSAKVPIGPVEVGPTISVDKGSSFEKEHRFKIIGNFWATKHGADWDVVYWDIKENRKAKQGIPDRLNVGVVINADGPFQGIVEVTVDTLLKDGLFGFPWSKDSPVPFYPGVPKGPVPKVIDFESLGEEDWKAMIPYEEEWQNVLVDKAK
ncbi:hypothetical protein IFR05_010506 [Cadophora sp. M221]|nr:hypothetical protein IFR05_010506 [Cadophora sp. M221]